MCRHPVWFSAFFQLADSFLFRQPCFAGYRDFCGEPVEAATLRISKIYLGGPAAAGNGLFYIEIVYSLLLGAGFPVSVIAEENDSILFKCLRKKFFHCLVGAVRVGQYLSGTGA